MWDILCAVGRFSKGKGSILLYTTGDDGATGLGVRMGEQIQSSISCVSVRRCQDTRSDHL